MNYKNYVFGASGHAKVVLDVIRSMNLNITAIIDDAPKYQELLNVPIFYSKDFEFTANQKFIIAIGDNRIRKKITEFYNLKYYTAIDQSASVSNFSNIGQGTVVMPLAVVNAESKIGNHCIINSRSVVEHDCILEDFVHISPNASLAGNVTVGEGSQVGIGASVIQGVKIGKWAIVGAGAVIIENIPDYAVVVGNPGKIIKYNTIQE